MLRLNNTPLHVALTLVVLVAAADVYANDNQTAQIDQLVQDTYVDDMPGAAFIVVKDGEVLYRGAKGLANIELGVSLTVDMVFRLGSITKQFKAASIMLLEERASSKPLIR